MALKLKCDRDYFVAIVRQARKLGGPSWDSFKRCFERLCQRDDQNDVELYRDFAPLSFGFAMVRKSNGRELFNGGIICHGAGSCGVGLPECSVTLEPKNYPNWQVHT